MLTGLGYRVAQAHDALSALRLLEGGRRYDLLFSDVVMPGPMHAIELAERAKALLPDCRTPPTGASDPRRARP